MKRKTPLVEVVVRRFGEAWEEWAFAAAAPLRVSREYAGRRTLAVPARQVICVPLWIEGTDATHAPEAAKLELEVRGLLSRAQGMDGVSLRILPQDARMLVIASVFPVELPEGLPSAERFEASPQLVVLARDAVTLWREGEDIVIVFTRDADVVYWETIDGSAGVEEIAAVLGLVGQRLMSEQVILRAPELVNWAEGLPSERICPPGWNARVVDPETAPVAIPTLGHFIGDWRPASAQHAESLRLRREKVRTVILGVAAVYIVIAMVLILYAGILRWQAGDLRRETAKLRSEVDAFQPIRRDWVVISPTIETAQFPLEFLRGAVEAMPKGNLHLTRFNVEGGKIIIEGESDSFGLATDYYNSLSAHEAFRGVNWSENRNPSVGVSVTSFHAEGTLPTP